MNLFAHDACKQCRLSLDFSLVKGPVSLSLFFTIISFSLLSGQPCPTFVDNTSCINAGPNCPGTVLSFGLDAAASTNLPNGATVEWVNDSNNDGNVYDEPAGSVIATQSIASSGTPAQTATVCGDINSGAIAFTLYSGNTAPESFSFITLENLTAGLVLNFTDNAWDGVALKTNEGTITWTVPVSGVPAGTTVTFTGGGSSPNFWTSSAGGALAFANSGLSFLNGGDNLFAYCGTAAAPTFISMFTTGAIITTGTVTTGNTYLPASLTLGVNAVQKGSAGGNFAFNCTGGSQSVDNFLANVYNNSNWATGTTAPSCGITYLLTTITPSCATYTVPAAACNTTLRIKPRLSPVPVGCSPGNSMPTLPTKTFVITCPTATISGGATSCSGAPVSMPIAFANVPASCDMASGTFSINGGSPVAFGPISITNGTATITGLTTAGLYTLSSVSFSGGGCTSCSAVLSGDFNIVAATNPAPPVVADQSVCSGVPSQLTGSGDPDLLWFSDAGLTNQIGTGSPISVNITTPATYYIVSKNPVTGCQSIADQALISITTNPDLSLTTPVVVCQGTTNANLSYSGVTGSPISYSIDYSMVANMAGFVDIAATSPFPASAIVLNIPGAVPAGTYMATLRLFSNIGGTGCFTDKAFSVTVNNPPSFTPTVVQPTCLSMGSISVAAITSPPGTYSYQYSTTGGAPFTSMSINGSDYTLTIPAGPQSASIYTILVTRTDVTPNCGTIATVNINAVSGCTVCSATLTASASSICAGLSANISAAMMSGTGPFTINIDSDGNLGTSEITNISYVSGSNIPVSPISNTTYTLVSVTDNGNGNQVCSLTGTPTIVVNPTPSAPTGSSAQSFCSTSNPTLASLVVNGANIKWYDMATGGNLLLSTQPLTNAAHYFASQSINGCESLNRLDVLVTLTVVPAPVGATPQTFILGSNATLANLAVTGSDIKWYDMATGGNLLPSTTILANLSHYYASQTVNGCESLARLDILVTLNTVQPPIGPSPQFFITGTNSTIADLIASGTNILWYATATGGSPLPPNAPLVNGITYYASQTMSGVESVTRLAVLVQISTTAPPPTGYCMQIFCIDSNPTVANLVATGLNILWYSTPTGGIPLATSLPLAATTYYASQTISGVESVYRFPVMVTLKPTLPGHICLPACD